MRLGYDSIGKPETELGSMTIRLYTDEEVPGDAEFERLAEKAENVLADIERICKAFLILPNEIRLETKDF